VQVGEGYNRVTRGETMENRVEGVFAAGYQGDNFQFGRHSWQDIVGLIGLLM
jgi:hypothetical protein